MIEESKAKIILPTFPQIFRNTQLHIFLEEGFQFFASQFLQKVFPTLALCIHSKQN